MAIDLEKFKENHKTNYLAGMVEDLVRQENETLSLIEKDPGMKELAEEDLKNIRMQKDSLIAQMEDILKSEDKGDEFPNEVVLEVRAGAGGEEAALFAEELALMYQKYAVTQGWSWKIIN